MNYEIIIYPLLWKMYSLKTVSIYLMYLIHENQKPEYSLTTVFQIKPEIIHEKVIHQIYDNQNKCEFEHNVK
jgi:hypothetical protein